MFVTIEYSAKYSNGMYFERIDNLEESVESGDVNKIIEANTSVSEALLDRIQSLGDITIEEWTNKSLFNSLMCWVLIF